MLIVGAALLLRYKLYLKVKIRRLIHKFCIALIIYKGLWKSCEKIFKNEGLYMEYVVRIHLKTSSKDRNELINFCLKGKKQYLAIGWSYVHKNKSIHGYENYYEAVKSDVKRIPHVLNVFRDIEIGDLFFTRDLDGFYWICQAKDKAQSHRDDDLDIGAIVPVKAYIIGKDIPGQIKVSFNRPFGGTAEKIKDKIIIEYAKYLYNEKSGKSVYKIKKEKGNFLNNLPPLDLEELVISYIQLEKNFYVLSNSIAMKSTTIKIECEFISRTNPKEKAVVQVKGNGAEEIDAIDYANYVEKGYFVYLYAPKIKNINFSNNNRLIVINEKELFDFYKKWRDFLPSQITRWENLFG